MKPDSERKKYYKEKLHQRKNRLNVHLSKQLREKLKSKRRSLRVRKGDKVKIMRGAMKGKEAKVAKVSIKELKVYLEGITRKNARGDDKLIPFSPSNLMLLSLHPTEERKKLFTGDVFVKEEKKEQKAEKKAEKPEAKQKQAQPPKPPKPEMPEKGVGIKVESPQVVEGEVVKEK